MDLFVGQYRHIVRAPVHKGRLFISHVLGHQAGKEPLFPTIIFGFTGGHLTLPIVGKAQAFELSTHVVDIFQGPLGRRNAVFDGRILGRHPEGVPTHRLNHIFAQHALKTTDHITNGIVAHMAHM